VEIAGPPSDKYQAPLMGNSTTNQKLELIEQELNPEQIEQFLLARKSFSSQELSKYPIFLSTKKKLVYDIACPEGSTHSGNLVFSRWAAIPLYNKFPPDGYQTEFEMKEDMFEYTQTIPQADVHVVEWYVNFADPSLFVAYSGALFAQDEMQVAEHPILGHLKEALIKACKEDPESKARPRTTENDCPTPILIRGIERRCKVATDANAKEGRPHGLYGNAFSSSPVDAIRRATTPIDPPTITNLICMAALGGGQGAYDQSQIVHLFATAYTSFVAAKIESHLAANSEDMKGTKKSKCIIHTGNWGTGAFGGDKVLMALIQIAAARLAKVDKLVYHTFNKDGSAKYNKGLNRYKAEIEVSSTTNAVIEKLTAMHFVWGFSDGN